VTALVVLGSSRSRGNTRLLVESAFENSKYRLVDLNKLSFSDYDYTHANRGDDFSALAEMLLAHGRIVLATPVYWYSMSATMKRFVDRLSDLVTMRKRLGRALAGRRLYVLATSTEASLPAGFEQTFRSTAEYLDMSWGGCLHVCFDHDLQLSPQAASAARRFGQHTADGNGGPEGRDAFDQAGIRRYSMETADR